MSLPVSRLRRWFALGAILMVVMVAGMYFYAQYRVRKVVHEIPAKIGLDIQQTAEGFSISKSSEGRTLFTVSASKAVQFKGGGRTALHNVKIVIYGKDSSRFDRIMGDDFEYDPASGNVSASGTVLIDLEANPEGPKQSDQAPPTETRNPIHVETNGLVFNKNTGDATASGKVVFATPQASGSAVGIAYVAKTGTMNLLSSVAVEISKPHAMRMNAAHGVISKQPRQVVLTDARLTREGQELRSDRATFLLRDDDTVDRILADGSVQSDLHGRSEARARSDHAELLLSGTRNLLTTATLMGSVHLESLGAQPAEADAGKVTLHFAGQQVLKTVHAEDRVRLSQKKSQGAVATASSGAGGASKQDQDIEMSAPAMDFVVKDGRLLERAETSGPPQIVITQPGANQKTVVTSAKFTAKFTGKNRMASLHGEPEARIISGKINEKIDGSTAASERVSTSQMLDVIFLPEGGIRSISQSGGVVYTDGTQKAWAQKGEYTAADQMLVLTGSPRVVDNGMTTTAQVIRVNRTTGDALAEGGVKSTYSDLKAQPGGGMLASSDPIHVTSRTMTVHRSTAVAVYAGDARLWQNANVVEAPRLQFDRDKRSLVAQGTEQSTAQSSSAQAVSTALVQADKSGKVTPVVINSEHLTYTDAERKIFLDGGVTARGSDTTLTGRQMTVFLLPHEQGKVAKNPGGSGQIDRIVAEGGIAVTQPARHATGEKLVYTAADDKFVLTGGPPSIFDAERGKITGDSLTFYRHDDRVLVEGTQTSPAVTKTQVAR